MREVALDCMVKVLTSLLISYEELTTGKSFDTISIRGDTSETDTARSIGNNSSSNLELINQFIQVKQQKSIVENGIDL